MISIFDEVGEKESRYDGQPLHRRYVIRKNERQAHPRGANNQRIENMVKASSRRWLPSIRDSSLSFGLHSQATPLRRNSVSPTRWISLLQAPFRDLVRRNLQPFMSYYPIMP